jgi:hypothetical protein
MVQFRDLGDNVDNDNDGAIDEVGERSLMTNFVYYFNDFGVQGNPSATTDFYNYLNGRWKGLY